MHTSHGMWKCRKLGLFTRTLRNSGKFSFSMISLSWVSVHVLIMCFHNKLLFHNIYHYCRFIFIFIIFVKCVYRLSGCMIPWGSWSVLFNPLSFTINSVADTVSPCLSYILGHELSWLCLENCTAQVEIGMSEIINF